MFNKQLMPCFCKTLVMGRYLCKMNDTIRNIHYPDVEIENGGQKEPLFWDYVGKPVWDVSDKSPIYTIDLSAGFSFKIGTVKQANYAHIIDAHKNGKYSKQWLFFKERNDANRLIKKVKCLIEDCRYNGT